MKEDTTVVPKITTLSSSSLAFPKEQDPPNMEEEKMEIQSKQ
jgi:hypothetical protein